MCNFFSQLQFYSSRGLQKIRHSSTSYIAVVRSCVNKCFESFARRLVFSRVRPNSCSSSPLVFHPRIILDLPLDLLHWVHILTKPFAGRLPPLKAWCFWSVFKLMMMMMTHQVSTPPSHLDNKREWLSISFRYGERRRPIYRYPFGYVSISFIPNWYRYWPKPVTDVNPLITEPIRHFQVVASSVID